MSTLPLMMGSLYILLSVLSLSPVQVSSSPTSSPCTPCPNPNDSYDEDLHDKMVDLPGLGRFTCGLIQTTVPALLTVDDADCQLLQSFGTYCGCPVSEQACHGFCAEYTPQTVLPEFLEYKGQMTASTCDVAQSYLQSMTEDSDECRYYTHKWGEKCGCHSDNHQENILPEENEGDTLRPSNTTESTTTPQKSQKYTSLCLDGSDITKPNYDLSYWFTERGATVSFDFTAGFANITNFTCTVMDSLVKAGLLPSDTLGTNEHKVLSGICGCPPLYEDHCIFCPTNDLDPDLPFDINVASYGVQATCGEATEVSPQAHRLDPICWKYKNYAHWCGCNQGRAWYLGAATRIKQIVLAWTPRIAGFLSLLGSLYIVRDIWKLSQRKNRNGVSTYHYLVLGMSIFDISSSLAWIVSTAALPKFDHERGGPTGIYGAIGNDTTCKIQGFFLELGFVGSTAFNASLTTFYVLSIVYNYGERRTKKLRKFLITIPVVLAITLASSAIPYYEHFYVGCFVGNPNTQVKYLGGLKDTWARLIVFSILPVGVTIVWTTGNLLVICRYVWKISHKADRWRFTTVTETLPGGGSHPSQLPRSNSTSWPRLLRSRTQSFDSTDDYENGFSVRGASNHGSVDSAFRTRTSLDTGSSHRRGLQRRASVRTRQRNRQETAVFWQAFWYVMAFLLTWVIFLVGLIRSYISANERFLYSFWVALVFLNPLMGFWNVFVYLKPWTWDKNANRRALSSSNTTKNKHTDSRDDPIIIICDTPDPEEEEEEEERVHHAHQEEAPPRKFVPNSGVDCDQGDMSPINDQGDCEYDDIGMEGDSESSFAGDREDEDNNDGE